MISKKHAQQIRRGIRFARLDLQCERYYRRRTQQGNTYAQKLLIRMMIERSAPDFLRNKTERHYPKLVVKSFREYVKRHRKEGDPWATN